jgi:hypothetical protein
MLKENGIMTTEVATVKIAKKTRSADGTIIGSTWYGRVNEFPLP